MTVPLQYLERGLLHESEITHPQERVQGSRVYSLGRDSCAQQSRNDGERFSLTEGASLTR